MLRFNGFIVDKMLCHLILAKTSVVFRPTMTFMSRKLENFD